jgi:hypothetical protein
VPPMTSTFETVAPELDSVVGDYCLWVTPTAKHFILEQLHGRLSRCPLHWECFSPASKEIRDNKYVLVAFSCGRVRSHEVDGDGLPGPLRVVGAKRGSWLDGSTFCRGADQAVLHVRPNVAAGCWLGELAKD